MAVDRVRQGRAARRKGKRHESATARLYTERGLGDAVPGPNRGRDIRGVPELALECKNVESLNVWKAMAQTISQADTDQMPVLHFTRNHEPRYVALLETDWFGLLTELRERRLKGAG